MRLRLNTPARAVFVFVIYTGHLFNCFLTEKLHLRRARDIRKRRGMYVMNVVHKPTKR